jgi:cyclopropane fatty-acyl-phospholipid synthase-like methyltransferase
MASIYQNGRYHSDHPTWHAEDSSWKARQILKMLARHNLQPKTIAEIGCGAGEILRQLHTSLPGDVTFCGYDISEQAHSMARTRTTPRLSFHLKDLTEEDARFDLLLVIDVFEHVEDYLGFLRRLRQKSRHMIFHIPLDLSAQSILRHGKLLQTRKDVGHLHYFTEDTALATLRHAGYSVEDSFFTAAGIERGSGAIKNRLAKLPRKLIAAISPSFASRLLGGFSLLVLASPETSDEVQRPA